MYIIFLGTYMKYIIPFLLTIFIISTSSAEISDAVKKQALVTTMITGHMNRCQAALSFLHDLFQITGVLKVLGDEPPEKQLEIMSKLKKDYNTIETEHLPRIRKFLTDNGYRDNVIIMNETANFIMYTRFYRDTLYKIESQNRGKYIQSILAYVSECTNNAQWVTDTFLEKAE